MATNTPQKTKEQEGQSGSFPGGQRPGQQAESVADRAREAAASAADQARDAASAVGRRAEEAASAVGRRAEDATSAVAGGMKSLAGSIRENAPQSGMVGDAAGSVARSLESGGRYLQEEGLQGIADDLTNLIRRNPVPALVIGVGIGFLLARSMRS